MCNSATTQKLTFGANTKIELNNMTTFDNTSTLVGRNVPYQMAVLSDVFVIIQSLVLALTPNGQFVGCATTAFSERYSTNGE
jgi:hypothetical protein